jgi:signal transduction histidine kinase
LAKFRLSIPKSLRRLRVQIVALFVLLGVATTVIFSTSTRYAFGYGWRDLTRPLVTDYVDRLAGDLGSPPSIDRAKELVARLPIGIRLSGPQVNWQSYAENDKKRPWPRRAADWGGQNESGKILKSSGGEPDALNLEESARPQMLARRSLDGHHIEFSLNFSSMEHRPHGLFWLSLIAILFLIGLAYWVVRRLLNPLDDLRAGALRFGRGDFSQGIAVRSQNELGTLAKDVNAMAKEIQHMLDAKRALLLAMSHELRSPITRAKVNTELLPDDDAVSAQKSALMADLNLMRDLIQDLLESEQLGAGHRALYLEETDLGQLVRDFFETLPSIYRARFESSGEAMLVKLDRARVRLLLRNLVDNAHRHGANANINSTAIDIRLEADAVGCLKLSVRDFGPGVADSEISNLAQPFHRLDRSRSRATGGVGLGLYLSRLVAEAHGATWSIRNARPGLEVSVIF